MSSSAHTAPALSSPAAKRQRTHSPSSGTANSSASFTAAPFSAIASADSSASAAAQHVHEDDDEEEDSSEDDGDESDVSDELVPYSSDSSDEEDDVFAAQPVWEWSAAKRQQRADADAQQLHDANVKPRQLRAFLRELFNGAAYPLPYLPAELSSLVATYALPPPDAAPAVTAVLIARHSFSCCDSACEHALFHCESDAHAHVQKLLLDLHDDMGLDDDDDEFPSVKFITDPRRTIQELLDEINKIEEGWGEGGTTTTMHILRA